jgi:hypothetical protein
MINMENVKLNNIALFQQLQFGPRLCRLLKDRFNLTLIPINTYLYKATFN